MPIWAIIPIVLGCIMVICLIIFISFKKSTKSPIAYEQKPKTWVKLEPVQYVHISNEYLKQLFSPEELEVNKFGFRPFIMFTNKNCEKYKCITAIPSFTVHNIRTLRYWYKVPTQDFKYYLNVEQMLYVPLKYVVTSNFNNKNQESFQLFVKKTDQINDRVKVLLQKLDNSKTINPQYKHLYESLMKCIGKSSA